MSVHLWREGEHTATTVGEPRQMVWPLDAGELEDLRWYLERYLTAPFAVWEQRGVQVQDRLPEWGERLFAALLGEAGPAREAYAAARSRTGGLEIVLKSGSARWLGLPWELMRDPARPAPLALDGVAVTRELPSVDLLASFPVGGSGSRLRVLMVICRPEGPADVGYQMVARPLLERLGAVAGTVELTVLRPPTFERLAEVLAGAARAGDPFQVVHFDGHGVFGPADAAGTAGAGAVVAGRGAEMFRGPGPVGMLAFEKRGGGADLVPAGRVAQALAAGQVPVVVMNACQSAQLGGELEASVATRFLQGGAGAVVAMAYSVYAVAAAEFMAVFYERLFAGDTIAAAVTAGRQRLRVADKRPSPKGLLPLADWMVPVHYSRREICFPALAPSRDTTLSLDRFLDRIRTEPTPPPGAAGNGGELAPDGAFVGRDALFYTLEVAARLQHVVVLVGPGGTGKTELAKGFARWWRDTGGVDDPRLVVWHSFEPGVASFGLEGVITRIGLQVFGTGFAALPTGQRRRVVQDLLAEQRALLVWDNFESVCSMPDPTGATPALSQAERDELRRFVDHVAAAGSSSVIITSRGPEEWLGPARRVKVGGLTREEANVYADRLLEPYPHTRAKRDRRAFGELMQWLDGHPLAMRLTLPLLDELTPDRLLEGMRGVAPLPGRDEGDRRTSLAACVAYSFTHLPPADRQALAAVSLFHGIADTNVLGAFSGVEGVPGWFAGRSAGDWAGVLDRAAAVGLLTGIGGGMYRIHPALPAYLAQQWRTDQPDDFDTQHTAATHALVHAYAAFGGWLSQQLSGGNVDIAVTVIALQRRSMGAMLGYALDQQLWRHALMMVASLNTFWNLRGLAEEARRWVERARTVLEAADGTPPGLDTPAGQLWLGLVGDHATRQLNAGLPDQAETTYKKLLHALKQQPATDDQRGLIAVTTHQLGMVAQERGRLEDAETWYRQSLTINEDLGNRPGMASSYHQLGRVAQLRGRLEDAETWYRQSLTIREDLGNRPGMATTYHQLGMVAQDRGRLQDAETWYRQSLTINEDLGNRPGMATTYHQLGIVAQDRGRLQDAETWYRQSLTIKEDLHNRPGMATTYHQLGILAQDRGRLQDAETWYRQSLTINEDLHNRPGMASSYHQLGIVAQERGRLQDAETWYRQSLTINEDLHNRPGMATTYHQLGIVAQERGRLEDAETWYRQSLTINEDLGNRPGMALTYGQLGLLAEERGHPTQALEWTIRSIALFEDFPHPATGPAPHHLRRLTTQLGIHTLTTTWQTLTGQPLPPAIHDHAQTPPTNPEEGQPPS
ncbi:tetratricopeptide repeat protein [Actinomadura graeca]|uniref:Tetratricopeptide repeat protein n=1 Tax=Actinomadura graeca TaxID=2750812 RepID=A0ABX8R4A4_9ACTN|nr:tetratricopeptide repeat protein [Actinomadura graeca]QXJ25890.1 tetratricopeptide repeat protein [Actinomadura graeca]